MRAPRGYRSCDYRNLGLWLITLASALQRQTCAHRRLSSWHNRKLRWKRTRLERMLEQCFKQCSSSAWSMPQAMLKHAEGYPMRVVRTTYGDREQIMRGRGRSCGSTGLIFESKVCRCSGLSGSA